MANNLAKCVERHVLTKKRDIRREIAIVEIGASLEQSTARLAQVLADSGGSPSSAVQKQEQLVALADAIAELGPDQRDVIVMRHLEGMAFRDIGERLDRSEGAVRMIWLRAIERLRKLLDERGVA